MRYFWYSVLRFSIVWLSFFSSMILFAASPKPAPPANDYWSKEYSRMVKQEQRTYNRRSNLEKIVGGSLAFGLGAYGYYGNMEQRVSAKVIYSITQSGGILAISSGIVGLSSDSAFLELDKAFLREGEMTYEKYKKVVIRSMRTQELAEIKKTAISSGLLALLYGYNSYLERKGNKVVRNSYAFLAFNLSLFSGASFYKWTTFNDDEEETSSARASLTLESLNSVKLTLKF